LTGFADAKFTMIVVFGQGDLMKSIGVFKELMTENYLESLHQTIK
jgi:hypothetical protein